MGREHWALMGSWPRPHVQLARHGGWKRAGNATSRPFLTFDGEHSVAKVLEVDLPVSVRIQVPGQLLHLQRQRSVSGALQLHRTSNRRSL